MTQPAPSGETVPAITLQVGSRTVVIDNSQWMGIPIILIPGSRLEQLNDRCLVLRSHGWLKVLTAVVVIGELLLLLGEILYPGQLAPLPTHVETHALMVVLFALGGWELTAEARFDRRAGLLIHGPLGWRRQRPLADILAVQLFHHRASWGASRYQVFLILEDRRRPRRLLTQTLAKKRNLTWVKQVGQQLADFLGVPLVDQIPAGAGEPR